MTRKIAENIPTSSLVARWFRKKIGMFSNSTDTTLEKNKSLVWLARLASADAVGIRNEWFFHMIREESRPILKQLKE